MTDQSPENIASHLTLMARAQPYRPAVFFPEGRDARGRVRYTHFTFGQLDRDSDTLASAFRRAGVGPGVRTALMVPPSLDFFSLTFALFKAGAVPVLIDPGMGTKNLGRCLAEAAPGAFIGIPRAHAARLLLGWGRATIRTTVTTGRAGLGAKYTLRNLRAIGRTAAAGESTTDPEAPAAILFTSGSTGVAKGVVYTHPVFNAQVALLKDVYGIRPGEIDLPTFPLFALFGPALGMTAVIPDMDPTRPALVDPRKLIEAVEDFGVTNLFGSPAVINRLGRYGVEHGVKLPSLRRVISAGAPVPAAAVERFVRMLAPGVQVFTPYGATESLPVASIGSDEILGDTRRKTETGHGVCVGRPVPGMDVAVIPIRDDVVPTWTDSLRLPPGEVGEIVARGPVVTGRYFTRPEQTALAKITAPDGTILHRMGDVGYLDEAGRLWFCGRKSHRVVTPDRTFFTIPCEGVFNTVPGVFRTALVGVALGGVTRPVLCVELEPDARRREQTIHKELLARGAVFEHTRPITTILFHPAFPVDIRHNAKIFREQLAVWATSSLVDVR